MKINTVQSISLAVIITGMGMTTGIAWAGQDDAAPHFAWKDGAEIYAKVCALCHEATIGPILRGRDLDPLYIRLMVRNGSRAMPAFRASEIDDQSLEKLAEYVSKAPADR